MLPLQKQGLMAKTTGNKNARLLKSVEVRALSIEEKKKQQEALVPYVHKDCISNILIRLPLSTLQSARFVCKPWYTVINSPIFIDHHLRQSESVLIFLSSNKRPPEKPNTISVEAKLLQSECLPVFGHPGMDSTKKFYIQFLEIDGGESRIVEYNLTCLGNIRATCNGLMLVDNKLKKGGLIVMNPVTRKLMALPLGTLYPPHNESYGFAFSNVTGEYKVVHLFRDELGYLSCEILNLGMRQWRAVNGPTFGLFGWFGYMPVSAIGALHWVPHIDRSDYIVSMDVEIEKFQKITLPDSCRIHDGIVEMGGSLSFVRHEEPNQIDVWILKGLDESWTKQHSITMNCLMDMVPVLGLRIKGDLIFKRDEDRSLYAYDFELQVIRKVEIENGAIPMSKPLFPHVNSLVSWSRESCHGASD